MVEQIKKAGKDRARRAIGGLLDLQSARTIVITNERRLRRQAQLPNHRDSSDSEERDRGPLTLEKEEEEEEEEDRQYRSPYGDNERGYVENCGSERHRLQVAATDAESIHLIEEIGAIKTIPGLSDYMSTLKENRSVAKILAPAVVSCTAGLMIQNEAGTHAKMIILEDLISLLSYRSCARLLTLNIMELYIGRQILHGDIRRGFQKIVLIPHHLLDHCEKPDILEDLRLRLRLPDAPSLNDGNNDDV
ncbi:MAG: hypothetical protein Q9164_000125 [Protoblastenia rupestris]